MDECFTGVTKLFTARHRAPAPSIRCLLDESPVAGLLDDGLAAKFHAWFGGSGRRYLASVFTVERDAEDLGLPDFGGFVLIAVGLRGAARRALAITAIETGQARHRSARAGLALGAEQWHVHLLGIDSVARAAIVADLVLRHAKAAPALSA